MGVISRPERLLERARRGCWLTATNDRQTIATVDATFPLVTLLPISAGNFRPTVSLSPPRSFCKKKKDGRRRRVGQNFCDFAEGKAVPVFVGNAQSEPKPFPSLLSSAGSCHNRLGWRRPLISKSVPDQKTIQETQKYGGFHGVDDSGEGAFRFIPFEKEEGILASRGVRSPRWAPRSTRRRAGR